MKPINLHQLEEREKRVIQELNQKGIFDNLEHEKQIIAASGPSNADPSHNADPFATVDPEVHDILLKNWYSGVK